MNRIRKIIASTLIFLAGVFHLNAQKIAFSDKPFFEGGTEKTEFQAGKPIYARVMLPYAVKKYCSNLDLLVYKDDDVYAKAVEFSFAIEGKDNISIKICLTKDQLDNKYIDFDIAPEFDKSTTIYFNNGYGSLKNYIAMGDELIEKGKLCISMTDDNAENTSSNNISGLNVKGNFCINYSGKSNDDLSNWNSEIEKSIDNAAVNYKKLNQSGIKMEFSSKPFAKGGLPEKEFKAGQSIYGRITLPKVLKNYTAYPDKKSESVPQEFHKSIVFKPMSGNGFDEPGFPSDFIMYLTKADLEKNYIDFDVMPIESEASSTYDWNMSFSRAYANEEHADTRKKHFGIKNQNITSSSSFTSIDVQGDFYIEYDGFSAEAIKTWATNCENAYKAGKVNATKKGAAESITLVKSMPLPNIFNKPSKPGFKNYTSAAITQMIKSYLKVNEVFMLTYGENKEQDDFEVRKNDLGIPISKTSNFYFYFIFKDTDGAYKASGAYLIEPYEGSGKYGKAYMKLEGCITSGDANYPIDTERDANGFNYIIFVDGAKVKK